MTTSIRRALLGMATATTIAASLVVSGAVSGAVAAQAASIFPITSSDHVVTGFDIATTASETLELYNTDTTHGGYGAFSPGDWICSGDPHTYARNLGFILDSEQCGRELMRCAKALDAQERETYVAAVTWYPDFPSMSGGRFVCRPWLRAGTPEADALVVEAVQILAAALGNDG